MDERAELTGLLQQWLATHIFAPLQGTWFWVALIGSVVVWFAFLGLLQALPSSARRRLLVVTTFLAGTFFATEFFWPEKGNPFSGYVDPLAAFLRIMGGFGLGIGIISLSMVHGKAIMRRQPGYYNSAAFFLGMILMIAAAFWQHYAPEDTPAAVRAKGFYSLMFDGLWAPLGATVFSLLAFFIVAAAYRAFRVRTVEASLMMVTAFIVMLGQVPVGMWLTSWIPDGSLLGFLRFERLNNWILIGINAAAFRAILFGSMVGYVAMSLRVWLSLEKGSYFSKEL